MGETAPPLRKFLDRHGRRPYYSEYDLDVQEINVADPVEPKKKSKNLLKRAWKALKKPFTRRGYYACN